MFLDKQFEAKEEKSKKERKKEKIIRYKQAVEVVAEQLALRW